MQAQGALLVIPPDVLIARLDLPSRGSKTQSGQQSAISAPNQVAHLGATQGPITQVMIPLDQFIPKGRALCPFHPLENQRLQSSHRCLHRLSGVGSRTEFKTEPPTAILSQGRV